MRIQITRRGGLAGVALSAELDTETLDSGTAARVEDVIERLVANGGARPAPAHPDAFEYEIRLPGHERSVTVGESELPNELRPLLRELSRRGKVGSPRPTRE